MAIGSMSDGVFERASNDMQTYYSRCLVRFPEVFEQRSDVPGEDVFWLQVKWDPGVFKNNDHRRLLRVATRSRRGQSVGHGW